MSNENSESVSPMEIDGETQQQSANDENINSVIIDLSDNIKRFDDELTMNEKMRIFYQRFFPYKPYYHWLNYETSPTKAFLNREFSFTLDDMYVRFQSFKDAEELKNELLRSVPSKIDIGAVYTMRPKDKKFAPPNSFKPIMKELVIDIDITDYDDVRQCCSKADICLKCWQFITVAIKIIDKALRDDFGFKHLLWVYSGRRGVHCWICDSRARKLDNDGRKAIISYLAMIKGGAQKEKKVFLPRSLHPSLERAYKIVDHYFTVLALEYQDIMDTPERWTKVLKCIPEEDIRKALNEEWKKTPSRSSTLKWDDLLQALQNVVDKNTKEVVAKKRADALETIKREIQFQYIYPRLDENVSAHINHLLKSPFCIHPLTGKVCVPISPDNFENFDPTKVPTVSSIICEMSQWNQKHPNASVQPGERKMNDYEKTSLKPYVKYFEDFVQEILKDVWIRKRAAQQRTMEF
ncbi:8624_t:CDS:10 [Ambispora leptoticha]|uniref:DNA primase n=1 Tax=Ambispora leptoticha TaxID=144679 RepID=A0A9N8VE14_9GLOM|nr:8624_t:CDS:10 [Ambispora leptoticha]